MNEHDPLRGEGATLRLVGEGGGVATPDPPRLAANDARWVLALRVADAMEDSILPAERRETLLRQGRTMGLSTFDANLVIAIVQEQARRGVPARFCPRNGIAQLTLVTPARGSSLRQAFRGRRGLMTAGLLIMIMVIEAVIFMQLMA